VIKNDRTPKILRQKVLLF